MQFHKLTYSLVFLLLAGCNSTQIDTGLQLAAQSFGLNVGTANQTTSVNQPIGILKITEMQKKQIINQLNLGESTNSGNLKIAIREAKSTIYNAISTLSCSPENDPPSYLGQFTMPETYPFSTFSSPLSRIGVNKNQCTTVKSISNWEIDENGKIKFTVIYMAADSEKTLRAHYFMQKQQSSGKWLFYRSYIS